MQTCLQVAESAEQVVVGALVGDGQGCQLVDALAPDVHRGIRARDGSPQPVGLLAE